MLFAPTALLSLALLGSPSEEPFRALAFDAAVAAAKQEGKVVMIDFFTTWCPPCKELDRTTWKDGAVVAWLGEKTVALKLDAELEVELAKRYRIEAYPTLLFLRADGTELDRLVGYRSPADFLEQANDALAGRTALTRAREALVGHENQPMARDAFGDALVQAGHYEEALEHYLWCYDHGLEHDPGYVGVRSSFLMSDILRLAGSYPPARAALVLRRDAAHEAVLAEKASGSTLRDLVTLNENLREESRTLELYDELLERGDPHDACRQLVGSIAGMLVDARRYDDVLHGVGNVADWFERELTGVRRIAEFGKRGQEDDDSPLPDVGKLMLGRVLVQAGTYYEALSGARSLPELDQPAPAEFEEQVLAVDATGSTYARLIKHAVRAEAYDRARAVLGRAESQLADEKELKRVRRAARKIPEPEQREGA